MLAIFLAPVYILANVFTAYWLLRWMKEVHPLFRHPAVLGVILVLYAFFALSLLTSFLIKRDPVHRILKVISNCWLGMYLYFLGFTAILVLLRFIFAHTALTKTWLYSPMGLKAVGLGAILFVTGMCIYGMVHAVHIYTTRYEVPSKKDAHLKIALVADLHLGYSIGSHQMEEMVEKINAEEPDVVVIAGDIFDNEYDAIYEPDRVADLLAGLKSRYGTYACYGNHDIEEPVLAGFTFRQSEKKESDPRMDEFLKDANITLLRDEGTLIDGKFYLYGRPDAHRPGRGIETRKTPNEITADMDKDKPIIVLDHQPKELRELADAGVDLDLCGHTHDGQMFPGNLIIKLMWENACGYLQKGQMHNIVTSGVGVFGPDMRVGTKAEICPITVHFTKD